ncbi:MAG: methylenetetrahydrofolate--tRNA-(uracil(54)-C(5))-methyltransferase (FADH(2)-oxidizing) TrmFO [Clostridiales bacterium]|jgi:methylenetetrahydrofolate--tRNA-(uracil-5-)-methyltransferase|nr:methylenetetrahydrofolate--tRNA-(uracil(54)-C(5))-methyltransferase (FADH(2)-oxidizing) TrmFO [Clostridiales bacterium]
MKKKTVKIIGAGLAGTEAAYQVLKRGYSVELFEMRPEKLTPAHKTGGFAELVCSNSLKSDDPETAHGLLKRELATLDSLLLRCAYSCRIPAGAALAVNRGDFSHEVENALSGQKNLKVIRAEVGGIDTDADALIVATGPLTGGAFAESLAKLIGGEFLYFFDAAAPIVSAESVDTERAFFASRYDKGDASDYLNCPMSKEEYLRFYTALRTAECAPVKGFERDEVFSGCMPIEVMAGHGEDTVRFGPLKPVGLTDKDGSRPYAVVQLRKENADGTMYNLVGFQTHLLFGEQKRVFSMIPALKNAEFLRYGVMHRNSFLCAPKLLSQSFALKETGKEHIFIAGQLSGVEGYVESIASGLMAGINAVNFLEQKPPLILPDTTVIGALTKYIAESPTKNFQPMNGNFGLLAPIDIKDKRKRKEEYMKRSDEELMKLKIES